MLGRSKHIPKYSLLIFLAFMVMQGLIISRLTLFGDDYYYATFFYNGAEHFIDENIFHYLETNGRALVHLLDQLLLAGGNIIAWQIFAFICIALTVIFSALIAAGAWEKDFSREKFMLSLAILSVVFSFISIATASQTLYWATGFMNYVFPVLLTLMLFFFTERALTKEKFGVLYPVLALLACATTEQNAFASLLILLLALIRIIKEKKKPHAIFILSLILGIIGFATLFAAPGNAVRTTYYSEFYSLSFSRRILHNIKRLIVLIFRDSGAARILVVFFFAAAWAIYEKGRGLWRLLLLSANSIALLLLIFEMKLGKITVIAFLFATAVFALDALLLLPRLFGKENIGRAFFTVAALICQGAMLVSPEMGPRTVIISMIFLLIPISAWVSDSKNFFLFILGLGALLGLISVKGSVFMLLFLLISAAAVICFALKKARSFALPMGLALLLLLSVNSLSPIISGYSENYVYHKENEALLEEYKQALDDGAEHILIQKYLPNGYCKYTMPYDDPYHMHWYKLAKKLPIDTNIIYE